MEREITNENFIASCPIIQEVLEKCDFIAVDCEFTGISSNTLNKNSLFDTSNKRYLTIKDNIEDYIVSQVGITAFCFHRDTHAYEAKTFLFYIYPRSAGSLQRMFHVEASAFEFLSRFDYDFNKFVKNGVTYLNNEDEKKIAENSFNMDHEISLEQAKRVRQNGPLLGCAEPPSYEDEDAIEAELDRIKTWLATSKTEDVFLEGGVWSRNTRVIEVLRDNVQRQFPTIVLSVVFNELDNETGCLYQKAGTKEEADLIRLKKCVGFSYLFKLLINLKKPLVGHNMMLDLMIMFNQFHEALPKSVDIFKKKLHNLFPHIYDTKHISYEMREATKDYDKEFKWETNDLKTLYKYFASGRGLTIVGHTPSIVLTNGSIADKNKPILHEAGWDSYCTGYCFIRMMHFFAVQMNYGCGMDAKPLTYTQHIHVIRPHKNRVNVSRGNIGFMQLDGPDPQSEKPQWLVLESVGNVKLDQENIYATAAANTDGSFDIKWVSEHRALIAVMSKKAAHQMRTAFGAEKGFTVQNYVAQRPVVRGLLWFGAVSMCASLCTLLVCLHNSRLRSG